MITNNDKTDIEEYAEEMRERCGPEKAPYCEEQGCCDENAVHVERVCRVRRLRIRCYRERKEAPYRCYRERKEAPYRCYRERKEAPY